MTQEYKFGAPNKYGDFPHVYAYHYSEEELIELLTERLPESFDMQLVDQDEIEILAHCVNQGIDSHLEAATLSKEPHAIETKVGKFTHCKYGIGFDPSGMICLLRRLEEYDPNKFWDFEGTEEENDQMISELFDKAHQLRSCIFSVLDITEE